MEVFILLVLSIGLCQAKAVHDELRKDDPEVANAVATAIKILNEDRSHGNKFALGVILHAFRIVSKFGNNIKKLINGKFIAGNLNRNPPSASPLSHVEWWSSESFPQI